VYQNVKTYAIKLGALFLEQILEQKSKWNGKRVRFTLFFENPGSTPAANRCEPELAESKAKQNMRQ